VYTALVATTLCVLSARDSAACSPVPALCEECGVRLLQVLHGATLSPDHRIAIELRCAGELGFEPPALRTLAGEPVESQWEPILETMYGEPTFFVRTGPELPTGAELQLVLARAARCETFEDVDGPVTCSREECCASQAEPTPTETVLAEFAVARDPLPPPGPTELRCQRYDNTLQFSLVRDDDWREASYATLELFETQARFAAQVCDPLTQQRSINTPTFSENLPLPVFSIRDGDAEQVRYSIVIGRDRGDPEMLSGELAVGDCTEQDSGAQIPRVTCPLGSTSPATEADAGPSSAAYRAYADAESRTECLEANSRNQNTALAECYPREGGVPEPEPEPAQLTPTVGRNPVSGAGSGCQCRTSETNAATLPMGALFFSAPMFVVWMRRRKARRAA
jgi:hypothetical protein